MVIIVCASGLGDIWVGSETWQGSAKICKAIGPSAVHQIASGNATRSLRQGWAKSEPETATPVGLGPPQLAAGNLTTFRLSPSFERRHVVAGQAAAGQEGLSFEDCDLFATATSYPYMIRAYQLSTADMKKMDQPLLDRLAARGFRLNEGDPDHTGFQMQFMRHGGGYYFNVGCSERVADGNIGLLRWDDLERFCLQGARLKDGSVKSADLIVVAAGYKNQQDR